MASEALRLEPDAVPGAIREAADFALDRRAVARALSFAFVALECRQQMQRVRNQLVRFPAARHQPG